MIDSISIPLSPLGILFGFLAFSTVVLLFVSDLFCSAMDVFLAVDVCWDVVASAVDVSTDVLASSVDVVMVGEGEESEGIGVAIEFLLSISSCSSCDTNSSLEMLDTLDL